MVTYWKPQKKQSRISFTQFFLFISFPLHITIALLLSLLISRLSTQISPTPLTCEHMFFFSPPPPCTLLSTPFIQPIQIHFVHNFHTFPHSILSSTLHNNLRLFVVNGYPLLLSYRRLLWPI